MPRIESAHQTSILLSLEVPIPLGPVSSHPLDHQFLCDLILPFSPQDIFFPLSQYLILLPWAPRMVSHLDSSLLPPSLDVNHPPLSTLPPLSVVHLALGSLEVFLKWKFGNLLLAWVNQCSPLLN